MKHVFLKRPLLFLVLGWLLTLNPAWAVEIIAHPNVAIGHLSLNQARSIFAMRQVVWPDGSEIKVFVLADQHDLHIEFCKKLLGLYPYQLRTSWENLVFSGMGQIPIEVASEEEMIARVARTAGAVGYAEKIGGIDALRVLAIH